MSNPLASGVNNANRVENEVAALYLARKALAEDIPEYGEIVPLVYDWQKLSIDNPALGDEEYFGYSMIEYRPGVLLSSEWKELLLPKKEALVVEIAKIFKAFQTIELPAAVDGYGGLTIKEAKIVSGESPINKGPPVRSNTEWWNTRLNLELGDAAQSPILDGWQGSGLRVRIDQFIAKQVPSLAQGLDGSKLVLVHSDLGNTARYLK
jgi:hypothetical protein